MNKILNIFSDGHKLYAYRWLVTAIVCSWATLAYFEYTGDGIFMVNKKDQQWNSSGVSRHK